jgi:ribosomal-protein-alanine N-acetyltransferase
MRRRGAFTLVAVDSLGQTDGPDSASRKKIHSPVPVEEVVGGFIVAEAGGRARGHVITIDVVSAARRSGVGSLLLRAAEDRLIVAGCRVVELETAVDNVSALSFYKRHCYSVSRTSPNYYSNGVDALVLEKRLI